MLERLLEFQDRFLARAANIDDELVRARFQHHPDAFQCVLRDDQLKGYFILLHLNRAGLESVRSGKITAGRDIQLSDLGEPVVATYLSVVCAAGPRAQHAAVTGVIDALRHLYVTKNVQYLVVRAATSAGAQMLKRLSGNRFEADGRIHVIDMSNYRLITGGDR